MKIKTSEPHLAEIDMTPMIDIVFQLIAFFMVITNFEQTEADERVKLPSDSLARPREYKLESELVLNIGFLRDAKGNKTDPDPFVFYAGEMFRVLKFGPKLDQEARLRRQKGEDPKDVTIIIRADAEVPTGLVQELMRMAQNEKAGFEKFALTAKQKSE